MRSASRTLFLRLPKPPAACPGGILGAGGAEAEAGATVVQVGDGLGVLGLQLGEQAGDVAAGVPGLLAALQGGDEGVEEGLVARKGFVRNELALVK
jgi:hypothetical protein